MSSNPVSWYNILKFTVQAIVTPPKAGLWSNVPETVQFDVPLLTSYTAGTTKVMAKIEIGRQDGWKGIGNGEGREITVLAASLQGVIKHHGIRSVITRLSNLRDDPQAARTAALLHDTHYWLLSTLR
jgi:hypothetical protein